MSEIRKVNWLVTVFPGVEVDGEGEISIETNGGFYGDMVERCFSAEELLTIAKLADAHKQAYQNYKDYGYEDKEYWGVLADLEIELPVTL